jgi:hypothetical protein
MARGENYPHRALSEVECDSLSALVSRCEKLEASLSLIAEIASISEGGAAMFYGMLARKGLDG